MSQNPSDNKRPGLLKRQFLVDRDVQLAILAYTFFVSSMTGILSCAFFLLLQSATKHLMMEGGGATSTILFATAVCFIILFLLALLGLMISNRIAGPIHRLRGHMRSISEGGPIEKIGFREKDHFSGLAEDYNQVLERLKSAENSKAS